MEKKENARDTAQNCEEEKKRDKGRDGEKELVKEKEQKGQPSQEPRLLEEKEKRISNGKNKPMTSKVMYTGLEMMFYK